MPCWTPDITGAQSDLTPFTTVTTLCCLEHRKSSIQINAKNSKKEAADQLRFHNAQLFCAFVFAYKNRFSNDAAHILNEKFFV